MQVIWCLKFSNMTNLGDNPPLQILEGGLVCPRPPVIYAYAHAATGTFLLAGFTRVE